MALSLRQRPPGLFLVPLLLLALALGAVQLATSGSNALAPAEAARSAADGALGKLPLLFVENRGQVDPRADFYLPGKDASVFFTGDGLRLSLADQKGEGRRYGLDLDFVGARSGVEPVGRERTAATMSYFTGPKADWKGGVPTYSEVAYPDVWPGIDLIYTGTGSRLKYSLLVKPGADPAAIQLAWQGATQTAVSRDGQLVVSTPAGAIRDEAPYSYQTIDGRRVKVESSYALSGRNGYGFDVGSYDRGRPLVIDPAMLVYAGFIGGDGDEQANNVVLDAARNLYVSGSTTAPDFPASPGSFDEDYNGGLDDAFVAKVNPSGTGLVWAGFIGGADRETAINIDVDADGAVYVDGSTSSTEASFPVTVGPDLTYNGGPQDAWVAKVTPDGTGLEYAGYIGGAGAGPPGAPNEQANGLAVDAAGNAYVSGFTGSPQNTFPDGTDTGANGDAFDGIPGYDQTFNSVAPGVIDAFVVKVADDGSGLDWGSYVGGGASDAGTGLVVDGSGNVFVNLFTGSNENPPGMMNPFGGFPATPGSFDPTFNGPGGSPLPDDAAAVKLDTTLSGPTSLVYATYIGGEGEEQPFGNAIDAAGNVYLTGRTSSTQATFPDGDGFGAIPGFDRAFNGATDNFVAKLNPSGSALVYATYIGGTDDEQAVAIALDSAGSAHVFGNTSSTQASFPVTNGPDSTYNGGPSDAYIAKLNPAGTALGYSGYVGGIGAEQGIGVTVDSSGAAYVAGSTDSDQASGFPVRVGPDVTFNGSPGDTDAFVAKIREVALPAQVPGPSTGPSVSFAGCPASSLNVIAGTAAGERITGTARADRIFGRAGNDIVNALGGNDCVDLGAGNDRATGGSGNDLMLGDSGRDRLSGNSGNDRLRAGAANDRIAGASGRDRADGGSGGDRISGGGSGDRLAGGSGGDRLNGDSGNDLIRGNSGNDRLRGGSGRDRISGGSGRDRISARDGRRDRISCGRGVDRVVADATDRVSGNCELVIRR